MIERIRRHMRRECIASILVRGAWIMIMKMVGLNLLNRTEVMRVREQRKRVVRNIKRDNMNAKGIGPQGLGVKTNNGYTIGSGSGSSPMKKLKDLSGDGKVTQKDVLIGRGVIESPLKLKDACYKKVKATYDVFPSAYASGAIAKCRKNKGKK